MQKIDTKRIVAVVAFALAAAHGFSASDAAAHPHVWVKVKTLLVVEGHAITGLKQTWVFDENFLASQLEEHDKDKDGRLSRDELGPVEVESQQTLETFKSFTVIRAGGNLIRAVKPRDVSITYAGPMLQMSFTVSLARPVALKGDVLLEIYDATYFSSFAFEGGESVTFEGSAHAGCTINTDAAPSPQQMRDYRQMLKEIGPEVKPFTPKSVLVACGAGVPGKGPGIATPRDQLSKDRPAGSFVGEATGSVRGFK